MRVVSVAVLLALVLPAAGTSAERFVFFHTPSRNIGCVESTRQGGYLRCDILSGLEPRPSKPRGCRLDWGFGYTMNATGTARITCAGDSANDPSAKLIPYGATWRIGPFRCTSSRIGLRCRNRSAHGFFLSRTHSYRF